MAMDLHTYEGRSIPMAREAWPHARILQVKKANGSIGGSLGSLGHFPTSPVLDVSPRFTRRFGSTRIKTQHRDRFDRFPSETDSHLFFDLSRSYSSNSVATNSVFEPSISSCHNTPKITRRGSRFPVLKRLASTGSGTLALPSEKKRTKSQNSAILPFVNDEKLQNILSQDGDRTWTIQEKFPNDNLRLYEGALICMTSPTLESADIQKDITIFDEFDNSNEGGMENVVFNGYLDKDDGPSTPETPRSVKFQGDISPGIYPHVHHLTAKPKSSPRLQTKSARTGSGKRGVVASGIGASMVAAAGVSMPSPEVTGRDKTVRFDVENQRENSYDAEEEVEITSLIKYSSEEEAAKFKKMSQRRQSAPSIVIRGVLGKSNKLSTSFTNSFNNSFGRDGSVDSLSPTESLPLSLKFGSHGAVLNLCKRTYVMEGKVQLTQGLQTQERYMFLFTDLLLIAKAKSGSNYKLKSRVRVCEMWTATCLDDVSESSRSPDKSFVIGWPTTNCVATFSSPESKDLWLEAFNKRIAIEKEKESPKTSTICSVRRDVDSEGQNNKKTVTISHNHSANDVIRIILSEFNMETSQKEYQLWAICKKEGIAYPLIGHEYPHAIHMSTIRDSIATNHPLYEQDVTCLPDNDPLITSCDAEKYQFILRCVKQTAKINFDQSQRRLMRIKNKTPSIFNWARKRNTATRTTSNSEGATFSASSNFDSFGSTTSSPESPKLFARPLNQICEEGEIPAPIDSIFRALYRKAPSTTGIFRKSAAAKTTRLLKERLNEGDELDVHDTSVHVLAALLKDFLRNIPDSLLDCSRYDDWTEAIDKPTDDEKLPFITKALLELDMANKLLLHRICFVLNKIASQSDHNGMTKFNLSICIAPSLLWPPLSAGPFTQADSTRKVAEIVQFLLNHETDVFDKVLPNDDISWEEDDADSAAQSDEEQEEVESEKGSSESSTDETEKEKVEDENIDSDPFNRSRHFRRQLQRRKPVNKPEGVKILSRRVSSSLDSLDLVEAGVPSSVTSTSNDSGFTTLSGEDDDVVYSTNSTAPTSVSTVTNTEVSLSTSVYCSTNSVKLSNMDDVRIATEELRNLWSPNLLAESIDLLTDDINPIEETILFDDDESEARDIITEFNNRSYRNSPRYSRRFSAPLCRPEGKMQPDEPAPVLEKYFDKLHSIDDQDSENNNDDTPPIVKQYLVELRNAPAKVLEQPESEDDIAEDEVTTCDMNECEISDENNNSTSDVGKSPSRPNTLHIEKNGSDKSSCDGSLTEALFDCISPNHHTNHTTSCINSSSTHGHTNSLPRKAHSMREGKDLKEDISPLSESERVLLSPIQKLTLNLHSIPDFRNKSIKRKESSTPKNKRKDRSKNNLNGHKITKAVITDDENNNNSNQVNQTTITTRQRRKRFAKFTSSTMSGDGASLFSFSVPSSGWEDDQSPSEPTTKEAPPTIYEHHKVVKTPVKCRVIGAKENSVMEKVQAFNSMISDNQECAVNQPATFVPLDSILSDYNSGSAKTSPRPQTRKYNGNTNNNNNNNTKLKISVTCSAEPPQAQSKRLTPQPQVSDDLLHTLSESFAFGNRKSPRNLTPLHTPGGSPSTLRRATEPCLDISKMVSTSLTGNFDSVDRKTWNGKTLHPQKFDDIHSVKNNKNNFGETFNNEESYV